MIYVLDFDGTIATRDVGAALLARFAPGTWHLFDWAMRRRLLSPRTGQALQWRFVTAPIAVLRREAAALGQLRPGFATFLHRATQRGDQVMVVTSGFRCYVEAVLGPLAKIVTVTSNRLAWTGHGYHIISPSASACCPLHSPCKAPFLHDDAIMVGDGLTDTCALATDARVYAVQDSVLHHYAQRTHRLVIPFTNFAELT